MYVCVWGCLCACLCAGAQGNRKRAFSPLAFARHRRLEADRDEGSGYVRIVTCFGLPEKGASGEASCSGTEVRPPVWSGPSPCSRHPPSSKQPCSGTLLWPNSLMVFFPEAEAIDSLAQRTKFLHLCPSVLSCLPVCPHASCTSMPLRDN